MSGIFKEWGCSCSIRGGLETPLAGGSGFTRSGAAHRFWVGQDGYGVRRVHALLRHQGQQVGRDRVGRLRREMGLRCRQKRCFRTTTDSAHTLPVAPSLLGQAFRADAPGRVWVTDITYVRTDEGWLYLAGAASIVRPGTVAGLKSWACGYRCHGGETATTMRRWRASGDRSGTSCCIMAVLLPGLRPRRQSRSGSRSSTTASACTVFWAISRQQPFGRLSFKGLQIKATVYGWQYTSLPDAFCHDRSLVWRYLGVEGEDVGNLGTEPAQGRVMRAARVPDLAKNKGWYRQWRLKAAEGGGF